MWFKWKTVGTDYCFREIAEATVGDIDKVLASDTLDNFALIGTDTSHLHAWQPEPKDEAYLRTSGTDPWVVFYQDRATREHLRSADRLTVEKIRRMFRSFLAGSEEWRQASAWHKMRAEAELLAGNRHRALFEWEGLGNLDGDVHMKVSLECGGCRATATVCHRDDALDLLQFLEEVNSLSGEWKRKYNTWNLDVACFGRADGDIFVEIQLDENIYDPWWTVEERLIVKRTAWPELVEHFRDFFAAAEGT